MKTVPMSKVLESMGAEAEGKEKRMKMNCGKFHELTLKEQAAILDLFLSEFLVEASQAVKDYNNCTDVERALHLDAAMNGYM